ncbi:MAG: IS1096 element passenger TnpR family protein [Moorellaceae bacterium]
MVVLELCYKAGTERLWRKKNKVDPRRAVYQFKVTLRDVYPPVWRRFQVPSNITLSGSLSRKTTSDLAR